MKVKNRKLSLDDLQDGDVLLFEDWKGAKSHGAIAAAQAVFSHRRKASSNVTHAGLFLKKRILEASGEAGLRSMKLEEKKSGSKYQVYRLTDPHALGRNIPQHAALWGRSLVENRNVARTEHAARAQAAAPDAEAPPPPLPKSEGFGRYSSPKRLVQGTLAPSNRGKGAKKAERKLCTRGRRRHRPQANAAAPARPDTFHKPGKHRLHRPEHHPNVFKDRDFYCSNFVAECYAVACRKKREPSVIDVDYRHVTPKVLQANMRDNDSPWQLVGIFVVEGDE